MPTIEDILDAIDTAPIVDAIRAEPLVHWGYEDAAKIVWNVASRFLPGDLERYAACKAVEQHWALKLLDGRTVQFYRGDEADQSVSDYASDVRLIHGYADLVMLTPELRLEVIDWKTAAELDKAWSDRLDDSWQWRLYCAVYGASSFVYRGIEKSSLAPRIPGMPYDWGKAPMKELRYTPSVANNGDVLEQLASTFVSRDALEEYFPFGHWPRRMPEACRSFGQRCAYWDVCRGGVPEPEGLYTSKPLSYSGMGRFLNCNEHYRLATLTGVRESSPATDLGNAVHRGTAALYAQFNRLKETFYGDDEADAAAGEAGSPDSDGSAGEQGHSVPAEPVA
jgi:PD-(D/E)XK nuclease superfamily protein